MGRFNSATARLVKARRLWWLALGMSIGEVLSVMRPIREPWQWGLSLSAMAICVFVLVATEPTGVAGDEK